jgi:hypothetical protein
LKQNKRSIEKRIQSNDSENMLVPLKMLKFPSMTKQEKHPTSFSEFTANIQVTKENSSQ